MLRKVKIPGLLFSLLVVFTVILFTACHRKQKAENHEVVKEMPMPNPDAERYAPPSYQNTRVQGDVYDVIEQMPEFPGGEGELMKFLGNHIKYPLSAQEKGIQGKVILQFVVTKTGAIADVIVIRSLDPACDREAVRVVKLLPRWIPGKQDGENVNVRYTLPVAYKL